MMGPTCDQHRSFWNTYSEGDKDSEDHSDPIILDITSCPPGTIITVKIPHCPECGIECPLESDICDCGFNWKEWVEYKYS